MQIQILRKVTGQRIHLYHYPCLRLRRSKWLFYISDFIFVSLEDIFPLGYPSIAFARYASRNHPLAKLFRSSQKVAWKGSSHLISIKENSSNDGVTMSTSGTITLPSFNILLSGTDAAIEDLAILDLFSVAIELHLSLAGSLCR